MIRRAFYSMVLVGLSSAALPAPADDSALIDALVRKGVLTRKEAEEIQTEVEKQASQASEQSSPNNVLKLGNWINELDIYGDASFAQGKNDAYQFETQLQGKLNLFNNHLSITWAPGVWVANSAALGPTALLPNGQPNPATGTAPSAGTGAYDTLNNAAPFPVTQRDELFLIGPGEIAFKLGKIPVSIYWDFSYNLEGDDRFNDVYGPLYNNVFYRKGSTTPVFFNQASPKLADNLAWLVGMRVGQNKKAGDIGGLVDFRQIGIDAVDPNINSDDFGNSNLNVQGVPVNLAYNFTDFLVLSFTGRFAWNLVPNLYGGYATSPSAFPIANVNAAQTIAVDLLLKF